MALTGPLKLSGKEGSENIYNTRGDIQPGYTSAAAVDTGENGTLWVVYTVKDWDHDHPADNTTVHVIDANTGSVNVSPGNILSAQGFNVRNPGIIMFEHSQYRGYGQLIQNNVKDLTQSFDQGKVSGVSSVIITGGVWALYKGYNCTGTHLGDAQLKPGRYNFGHLSINDQAKSAKYIGPD